MERYDHLDLECDGSVVEKAAIFGGMFKRSSKSTNPSFETQDNLSANSELSNSSDSLNENNVKEKGGMFKGILKKSTKPMTQKEETSTQATLSVQNNNLSASSDSLNDGKNASKEKTGIMGGFLRRSPKPGHSCPPSQNNLSLDGDMAASNESLSENNSTKEQGSKFGAMFKKSNWTLGTRMQSQDDQSAPGELSGNTDNLSESTDTKEKGGIFSGVFKKPKGLWTKSQEDLSTDTELSTSSDNISEKTSKDDLSAPAELSGSTDNLSEHTNTKEKGMFSGVFKKPKGLWAKSQSQEDLLAETELSTSSDSISEKTSKGGVMGKLFKNQFHASAQKAERPADSEEKQVKGSDSEGEELLKESEEGPSSNKQNKRTGAMSKLNLFANLSANKQKESDEEEPSASGEKPPGNKQKNAEEMEAAKEIENQVEEKLKKVKGRPIQREGRDEAGMPTVPSRPAEENNKNMIPRERETPPVPTRPTEEEMSRVARRGPQKQKKDNRSDDEAVNAGDSLLTEAKQEAGVNLAENKAVKKPKRHNPFMPRATDKTASDDEGLREEEKNEGEAEKNKGEETSIGRPKKRNPFMPHVKIRTGQRNTPDEAPSNNTTENEGGSRSLFDQLEDLRIEPTEPDDDQDMDGLMDWWNTVEQWEDMPQDDDMTEKEEAKAFAMTAEKVQKAIRVFNKLFSERAESLWQHVINLNAIADGLDRFNKKTKIAQITGGSTSAIGGVATIAGLALAPVTFGTSLIVTAVGLGVATAGGLTSAGAGISNQVNNSMDRKKVEKIVEDYQEKMADINKCMTFIKQGIENLRRFDLIKMNKHAYNRDFPALNNIYEDGAMAGKAILINANEIMRVVQIANVAGSTAARAVQIASMATGVLTGLFVGMDIYFVAKDSKELKKGAKSEFAGKIREVANQLHEGLVELNGIRQELQSTESSEDAAVTSESEVEKKAKEEKPDSSDEDEIDRIKKAIKKDYENREYV